MYLVIDASTMRRKKTFLIKLDRPAMSSDTFGTRYGFFLVS